MKQAEFCKNDVHDWKYEDATHRECKHCGVKHAYQPDHTPEWQPILPREAHSNL